MPSSRSIPPDAIGSGALGDAADRIRLLEQLVGDLKEEIAVLKTRHVREDELKQGLGSAAAEREALGAEVERLAHVGSWCWDVPTGAVAWSDEFYRIFGYDPRLVEPSRELFFKALHPDDRERMEADAWRSATTGVAGPRARARLLHADGSVRTIEMAGAPIRNAAGELVRLVGAALDVTDYVTVETELRKTAQLLTEAQRIAQLGSWIWRLPGEHIEWTEAMYGIFKLEPGTPLTPERFFERAHPEDKERVTKLFENPLEHTGGTSYRIVWPDGSVRHLSLETTVEPDAEGKPLRVIGTVQDVSSRQVLEEQLRHSQKMEAIGTLAGGVAHDFNNYLVVIQGNIDLLRSSVRSDGKQLGMLDEIGFAVGRCTTLTRQLLAFSRKQATSPRRIDLGKVVSESSNMLRRLLGEHIDLLVHAEPGVSPIRADPAHIEQVIVNLAVNARDAMPSGGRLNIEAGDCYVDAEFASRRPGLKSGAHVVLRVSDNGSGIPKEVQPRIFEPFFTTKELGRGTGLGLATVYGIVQQSGGHIEFSSKTGRGTSFEVYFPAYPGKLEESASVESYISLARGESILLAEDEPLVRRLTRRLLERAGYRVFEAEDGLQALEVARHMPHFELLLTDVTMPHLGGVDLALRLREAKPHLRILFISGYPDAQALDPAIRRFRMVAKPFTMHQLLRNVRDVLDEGTS